MFNIRGSNYPGWEICKQMACYQVRPIKEIKIMDSPCHAQVNNPKHTRDYSVYLFLNNNFSNHKLNYYYFINFLPKEPLVSKCTKTEKQFHLDKKNKKFRYHNGCPSFVINITQHKVAFVGCSPITAVIIIPVHTLCWRISAPRTNILHRLGNNLRSCRCWVDNVLVIRLQSKTLKKKTIQKQGLIIYL